MSLSRQQLNEFLREIDITDKIVLDIGVQDKPASNFTKGAPKEYKTVDIDPQWNPNFVLDINEPFSESTNFIDVFDKQFDVVFCLETFEHVFNPIIAILNIHACLKDNGVAYISVPFINPIHDTHDMLRYTEEWFHEVGKRVGFKRIVVYRRQATAGKQHLLDFYKAEGLRMSKIRLKAGESHKLMDIGYFVKLRK